MTKRYNKRTGRAEWHLDVSDIVAILLALGLGVLIVIQEVLK